MTRLPMACYEGRVDEVRRLLDGGADIHQQDTVGRSPLFHLAAEIALYHHEKWDGSGYPGGISGEAIPESARIVAARIGVFTDGGTKGEPHALPVFRDVAHAALPACLHIQVLYLISTQGDGAGTHRHKPCQRADELCLAIAADAGNANDLACTKIEGNGPDVSPTPCDGEVIDGKRLARGRKPCGRLRTCQPLSCRMRWIGLRFSPSTHASRR